MSKVVPFKKATTDAQHKANKMIGDYAARMWLAGVDIHIIDMRLKPQKPVRQLKVAA